MSEDEPPTDISKSICEAALERYSALDDSLADLIRHASIEVRDFMLLSFICDQGSMNIEQIGNALGLSRTTTQDCIDRLVMAQLVYYRRNGDGGEQNLVVSGTSNGRRVTRHIHGDPA